MYPQSMLLSRNKKNNVYPVNPSFTGSKWGLRGSKLYVCFRDEKHVVGTHWKRLCNHFIFTNKPVLSGLTVFVQACLSEFFL